MKQCHHYVTTWSTHWIYIYLSIIALPFVQSIPSWRLNMAVAWASCSSCPSMWPLCALSDHQRSPLKIPRDLLRCPSKSSSSSPFSATLLSPWYPAAWRVRVSTRESSIAFPSALHHPIQRSSAEWGPVLVYHANEAAPSRHEAERKEDGEKVGYSTEVGWCTLDSKGSLSRFRPRPVDATPRTWYTDRWWRRSFLTSVSGSAHD